MSRYDGPGDNEFEPGSNNLVLRNKLGLTTQREIELAESLLLAKAIADSFDWGHRGMPFDIPLVCEMHRRWLGSLYSFAGTLRTVDVSKSGILFCPVGNLPGELDRYQREILSPFHLSDPTDLARLVAVAHAELMIIHPFREGNGRVGRWLLQLMVMSKGRQVPDIRLSDPDEKRDYFAAMRRSFSMDYQSLTEIVQKWIERGQEPVG